MIEALSFPAIWLTLQLALVTTILLLIIGPPIAWWLAKTPNRSKPFIEALIALPLVLPPTVIGFYLLISFAPDTAIGRLWFAVTGENLAFSFNALVIGSMLYSLPFVIQPIQSAFEQLSDELLEAAATLGASPLDRFFTVAIPTCKRSVMTAASLGFAHTVGEFGIILMIGGNIPGKTQVLSIALYDRVETLQYTQAHWMAGGLLAFSFVVLALVYRTNRQNALQLGRQR